MKQNIGFTPLQRSVLVAMRVLIGWHLLYEGISKLLIPNWTSATFLNESKWILSDLSGWIVSNTGVLHVVDFLNTWGLIAIGLGLIIGLFTRAAAISGSIMLLVYYMNNPPLIGFGTRGQQLANGLGFMHPEDTARKEKDETLAEWLGQEYLNVALTGICDVFDLHAEAGTATAQNERRPGGSADTKYPVKRYRCYKDMLNDKEIDAVIIATPDHHHAQITVDAIKAGKHVYCEKSIARTEDELFEVYETVRNSDKVFQLGHQITQNVVFQQAKEIIKKDILGKITHIETTSNRNTASGAWIRHLDENGNPKPDDEKSIDWLQWLGSRPYFPFSIDRYYNWTKWFDYDTGMIGQLFTHEFDAVNQLLRIGIPKTAISSGGVQISNVHLKRE